MCLAFHGLVCAISKPCLGRSFCIKTHLTSKDSTSAFITSSEGTGSDMYQIIACIPRISDLSDAICTFEAIQPFARKVKIYLEIRRQIRFI